MLLLVTVFLCVTVQQANREIETIEERYDQYLTPVCGLFNSTVLLPFRFPPARKTVANGTSPSTTMSLGPPELDHQLNHNSPERRSDNSSALGPPAYSLQYNPRLQMQLRRYNTPSYDDSHTVSSSDVDKPDMTESEFSEPPVRARMPTFGHSIAETEGDDPASFSTFV